MSFTAKGSELQVLVNGSVNVPLVGSNRSFDRRLSHYEQQNRVILLGGTMWVLSYAVGGVSEFVSDEGQTHLALYGTLLMVQAVFETIGAMLVAATDGNVDHFAERNSRCVIVFTLGWIVLYMGLSALSAPIQPINAVFWIATLPFVYLLLRFKAIIQMDDENNPRFSDLLACSLALDLGSDGLNALLEANLIIGPVNHSRKWPYELNGSLHVLAGALVFAVYWYFRRAHSRQLALSFTLYSYLLLQGFADLSHSVINRYANDASIPPIDYGFPIIHITFPLAYFLFGSHVYLHLGRYWLEQRSANADSIAQEQSIVAHHGNLEHAKQAITTETDLNTYIVHGKNTADRFTLLILACFNGHAESVDLLLESDTVQVNKGSLRQHWTPLYVAAMRGNSLSVEKLITRGANVHAKTEDGQTALLAATMFGYTKIVQQLMEAGAHSTSTWLGIKAVDAAEVLGRESTVKAYGGYESHFQGYISKKRGCVCVASWPGIYCKSW
jgi:hypothetical protein